MADLTRADYERRIDDLRAERAAVNGRRYRDRWNALDLTIAHYASVLRRLDWLPPAEIRAEGIGRRIT